MSIWISTMPSSCIFTICFHEYYIFDKIIRLTPSICSVFLMIFSRISKPEYYISYTEN